MNFCIRTEIHQVDQNWRIAATSAVAAITVVTKAFNAGDSTISCKKKIHCMGPLGLSYQAQLYLFLALRVARKTDFNQCIFSALSAQKLYAKALKMEENQ